MGSKGKHDRTNDDKVKKHLGVTTSPHHNKIKKKKDNEKHPEVAQSEEIVDTNEELNKIKFLSPKALKESVKITTNNDKSNNFKRESMLSGYSDFQNRIQNLTRDSIADPNDSTSSIKKKRKHKKENTVETLLSPKRAQSNITSSPFKKPELPFREMIHVEEIDHSTNGDEEIHLLKEANVENPQAKSIDKPEDTKHPNKDNIDCFEGWPKSDLFELVNRMLTAIPKNDTLKYNSRVVKLNWDEVKFGQYTADECREKWKVVEKRLRGYRILEELLSDAKQWIEKPWTDFYRSGKKNRHPEMPKRPLSSYMLFYLDKKEKYAGKNPGLEMTSLSKLIAEKYKKLPQEKIDKYNALASNMREEYKEKMQKFLQDHPIEAVRLSKNSATGTNKKTNSGMPGPTKPVPPFKLFLEDKVKQHKSDPGFSLTEFTLECKNKWKTMSRKKKTPWIRWAHEKEIQYLDDVKVYKSENPNFEAPPYKSVLSKEEKTILDRVEGKPEKPPNSAYSLFSRVMLSDPNLKTKYETPKERMQEIAKLWKSVPKVDKDMYAEEVKRMIDNYKMEYATYLDSLPEERREEELASNLPKRKPKGENRVKKEGRQMQIDNILKKTAEETREPINPEELLAKEPIPPPSEPFKLFRNDAMNNGEQSERKIKKAWGALSDKEKEKYSVKLQDLKQQYFIDYKLFLTSLKPEELKVYSSQKVNPSPNKPNPTSEPECEMSEDSDDSSSTSECSDDSDDKMVVQDVNSPVKVKKSKKKDSSSEDSSSSSSSESETFSD